MNLFSTNRVLTSNSIYIYIYPLPLKINLCSRNIKTTFQYIFTYENVLPFKLLNLFPKTKTILHDIGLQHLNIIHLLDLKRTEDNVPLSSDTASLHVHA